MTAMQFKTSDCCTQLQQSPQKLQDLLTSFCELAQGYGIDPVITRVWDPVPGDSGVHEAHRGVDIRDQLVNPDGTSENIFTPEATEFIVSRLNALYPRDDGKLVCIHHSFCEGPFHFHLQIPASWV